MKSWENVAFIENHVADRDVSQIVELTLSESRNQRVCWKQKLASLKSGSILKSGIVESGSAEIWHLKTRSCVL